MTRLILAGLAALALLIGSWGTDAVRVAADPPFAAEPAAARLGGDRPLQPVGDPGTDAVRTGDFPTGGPPSSLTGVRAAGHRIFDRFVLEFDGDEVPSYQVGYVDPPVTADGSGQPVALAGTAFLQVRVAPASGAELSGGRLHETYTGPQRLDLPRGQVIVEAVRTGDFESMLTWTLGLDHRASFGVATLTDPARLVVDVLHRPAGGQGGDQLEPIGPAATAEVTVPASGSPVVLADVRVGAHDGFDRVVFELTGDGSAGYRVGYTDDPRGQGSGQPVPVPGDAALGITLTGLLLPPDAPPGVQPWDAQPALRAEGTTTLRALVADSLVEGRYSFFAGLDERRPFAVARLDHPQRIVVDVLSSRSAAPSGNCTSLDGVSVRYPGDWSVNTGDVAPPCTRFAPREFSVPANSDVRVAAISVTTEPVPFEQASRPPAGLIRLTPLCIDGREAVRIQQESAEGLYPVGTPITTYAVDLGVGDNGPQTLIATTVGLPGFDYDRNVEVLDRLVRTLGLPPGDPN